MKTYFIISKGAGSYSPSVKDKINRIYRGKAYQIYETDYKCHIKDLVRAHRDEDARIYICGGDGSLSEAAPLMIGRKASLGLVPMGTANDFAKNFPKGSLSIENTLDQELSPMDLIKINDSYCVNVFSLGLDSQVLAKALAILDKNPWLKGWAYPLGVLASLPSLKANRLTLDLVLESGEKKRIEDSFLLAALCNGGYYGSGFNPSPKADIKDGLLDLVMAKDMGIFEVLGLVMKYRDGRHLANKKVLLERVKSGRIKAREEVFANIDGLVFEEKTFDFEILPQAINFTLPEGKK